MEIKRVPIEQVEPWEKNPRGILKKDFDRLKKQIQKLGVYKPLVACRENGKYIVLGGNMRIRALQELGFKEVEISVVKAETEKEKIEYSLSDNDRVGYYEEEKLAELVWPHLEEINLEDFKIDIRQPMKLKDLIEDFGPDLEGGGEEIEPSLPEISKDVRAWLNQYDNLLVEFSGGKDSLLALLWAEKAAAEISKSIMALFVETGAEFPDLSSYISRLCLKRKINLVRLISPVNIIEYYLRKGKWPDSIYRDCQHKFINGMIDKYSEKLAGQTVHIRGGRKEQKTARTRPDAFQVLPSGVHLYSPYYDMKKEQYGELLAEVDPMLWPGYKLGFRRTACWMCPFQRDEQWEALRSAYPLLWQEMKLLTQILKFPRHEGDGNLRIFKTYWNKVKKENHSLTGPVVETSSRLGGDN